MNNYRKSLEIVICALFLNLGTVEAQEPRLQWVRTLGNSTNCIFYDIYLKSDGNYALCGQWDVQLADSQGHSEDFWIVTLDPGGETVFEGRFGDADNHEIARSLIETDDGGMLIGGSKYSNMADSPSEMYIVKLNEINEFEWEREYGGDLGESLYALIELKSGDFLLSGVTHSFGDRAGDGYIVRIEPNGQEVWARNYNLGRSDYLASMRETDDGVLLAGGGFDGSNAGWLLKIDDQGEVLFSRSCRPIAIPDGFPSSGTFASISSCRGGFIVAGLAGVSNPLLYWIYRIDPNGERIWDRTITFGEDENLRRYVKAVVRGHLEGFQAVGSQTGQQGADANGGATFTTSDEGDLVASYFWPSSPANLPLRVARFESVVIADDGSVIVAGTGFQDGFMGGGLVLKLAPEHSSPIITHQYPEVIDLKLLRDDSVIFDVDVIDLQADSILYQWRLSDEIVSTDTSYLFGSVQTGDFLVECKVADASGSDSANWTVQVTDLFITTHTPDTLSLTIRRGTTQTFSLDTVRAVEGDPVQYQWTLTNLDNFEREDAGTEPRSTIEFLRSGNYQMEGLAYRGESSDNVIWTIAVRSAILDFWPRELNLSVLPDSSGEFGVIPFNPESDSLSYRWEVDGDSVGADSTVALRFAWNGQAGRSTYAVSAIVMDGAEGDTVRWEVTVQDPNATPPTPPSIEGGEISPSTFGILSVSPNPFNSTTTIRYATNRDAYPTRLTVHDLTGREAARLVDERAQQSPPSRGGPYAVTFNGRDLPAGIYLIRLQAGEMQRTAKVVLVR